MWLLQQYYYLCVWLSRPFDNLWKYLFAIYFCKNESTKFFVTGISGGEYKTTLATSICEKYELKHISIDNCFYGKNWTRNPIDVFEKNILNGINSLEAKNGFVIEGCYSRPDVQSFHMILDKFIRDVDVVIYLRIPWYISIWRKAWRSYKRAIGVSSQGTNPETLKNVYYMLKSVWGLYGERRSKLDKMFEYQTNKNTRFICADWPNYVILVE